MQTISWRYIFWMLASVGALATVAVFSMMFWMTSRIDQNERKSTRDLIQLALAERTESLTHSVEDYSYWNLAYEVVRRGDKSAIYDNIGSGATDGALFDQIFILDAGGNLLHAYAESGEAPADEMYDGAAFATLLSELTALSPQELVSVAGVVESGSEYFLVSAAWITPDNVTSFPDAEYPVMIGTVHLDNAWRTELANKVSADALILSTNLPDVSQDTPVLKDVLGRAVVAVSWEKTYSGTVLRREVLPALILFCVGLLGICGSAARYFHVQHMSLEHATEIAVKDPLTGLLNRAGLQAVLHQKDVGKRLAKGHLATIYVDVNKFKALNDNLGHSAGDTALIVTAERLQAAARPSDFVARLGGDEFVCVVVDSDPKAAAIAVAEKFMSLSKAPIAFDDHSEQVTSSVGVSVARAGTQWETLISQSDAAMYWSKKREATEPVLFSKAMNKAALAA